MMVWRWLWKTLTSLGRCSQSCNRLKSSASGLPAHVTIADLQTVCDYHFDVTFQGCILDSLGSQKWPLRASLDHDGNCRVASIADLTHFLVSVRQLDSQPWWSNMGQRPFGESTKIHLIYQGKSSPQLDHMVTCGQLCTPEVGSRDR